MTDETKKYPPNVFAAKLYEKTSANGKTYLTGRLGGLKVYIPKSQETAEDGGAIWELNFSQAAPAKPKSDDSRHSASRVSQGGFGSRATDDEIPF